MNKYKIKLNVTKILFFFTIVFVIASLFQVEIKRNNISFLVCLTFLVNIFICLFMIFKEKKSYSLYKTYWYFSLIFYCFSAFIQYLSNYNVWNYILSNKDYLIGNIIVLCSNFIFILCYELKNRKYRLLSEYTDIQPKNIKINTSATTKIILFGLLIFCLLFSIKNIGLSNLFARAENSYSISSNNMFNIIFSLLCRGIPAYVFYIFYSQNNKLNLMSLISAIIIIILNFPTSTTRFWMGSIYIGIFLLVFNNKNKNNRRYDLLLLITFSVIFPLLFSFKFHDISYFIKNGYELKSLVNSYNSVDYDAYSIIPRSVDYVEDNGILYGKQFVGTALFLVPRQIWNNKPKPTGDLIANAQNQNYTNISCPFISEGFINFGILGIVVFQIMLSLICFKLDKEYWTKNDCSVYLRIVYPFFMGFLIYLLRGALHPAVVYLFCFCLPLFLIKLLLINGGKHVIKDS